VISTAVHKFIL